MIFSDNELKFLLSCVDQCAFSDTRSLRNKAILTMRLCDELEQRAEGMPELVKSNGASVAEEAPE